MSTCTCQARNAPAIANIASAVKTATFSSKDKSEAYSFIQQDTSPRFYDIPAWEALRTATIEGAQAVRVTVPNPQALQARAEIPAWAYLRWFRQTFS